VAGLHDVAASSEVLEGEAKGFAVDGVEIGVARAQGTVYAFSDICTHRRCNLTAGGELEGTTIECECHGSLFSIVTGEVEGPPATEPIATYPAHEADGRIQVEL
jgi:3-phenylpropionate/trans-cinnamate dioxygenase ferredoxin subunit